MDPAVGQLRVIECGRDGCGAAEWKYSGTAQTMAAAVAAGRTGAARKVFECPHGRSLSGQTWLDGK